MQTKRSLWLVGQAMLLAALLLFEWASVASGQNTPPISPKDQAKDAAEFQEFLDRVQAYVALHKSLNSSLPALKPTALPAMITIHQQALARKIREARPHA